MMPRSTPEPAGNVHVSELCAAAADVQISQKLRIDPRLESDRLRNVRVIEEAVHGEHVVDLPSDPQLPRLGLHRGHLIDVVRVV